jgi:hypothetical protein
MNATHWKRIALFVEGEEDRIFAERILVPRLQVGYDEVSLHTYAETSDDKLRNHFRSLVRMGSDFFLLVDYDRGPCITAIRQKYAQRYERYLDEAQVLVARPMIEAWYAAGVPSENPFKITIPSLVDGLDKQEFARIFGERAERRRGKRRELLQQILAVYDWGLALQRSASLRYCALKLGIAE